MSKYMQDLVYEVIESMDKEPWEWEVIGFLYLRHRLSHLTVQIRDHGTYVSKDTFFKSSRDEVKVPGSDNNSIRLAVDRTLAYHKERSLSENEVKVECRAKRLLKVARRCL